MAASLLSEKLHRHPLTEIGKAAAIFDLPRQGSGFPLGLTVGCNRCELDPACLLHIISLELEVRTKLGLLVNADCGKPM